MDAWPWFLPARRTGLLHRIGLGECRQRLAFRDDPVHRGNGRHRDPEDAYDHDDAGQADVSQSRCVTVRETAVARLGQALLEALQACGEEVRLLGLPGCVVHRYCLTKRFVHARGKTDACQRRAATQGCGREPGHSDPWEDGGCGATSSAHCHSRTRASIVVLNKEPRTPEDDLPDPSRTNWPDGATTHRRSRKQQLLGEMRPALLIAAGLLASVPAATQAADPQGGTEPWIATWAAPQAARVDQAPQSLPASAQAFPWVHDVPQAVKDVAPGQELPVGGMSPLQIRNQTLRQIAHVSLGGQRVRVVLSNSLGTLPLRVGAAHVALRGSGASIVAASDHVLTFGGLPSPTIPPGALLVSDPVDLTVPDGGDLAVDLYLPDDLSAWKSPISMHYASWQVNYVSEPGDHSGAPTFPVAETTAYRRSDGLASASSFFFSRVEVARQDAAGVLVAFGDSITDGTQSGTDQNRRWPDLLGARLAATGTHMAVVNGGIGGGRVLEDGVGPNALARFDRDVLAQPGVHFVTVLEGVNDIGVGGVNASPSVAELIAGHRQMIERAHARGLRILGATLTPFEGAAYWTLEGEKKRQALNDWIRTSGAYDGVIDFAAVVQDPNRPTRSRPEFDSGDHLHPSPAGYAAMANSIDLKLFQAGGR